MNAIGPFRALEFEFGIEADDGTVARAFDRCYRDLAAEASDPSPVIHIARQPAPEGAGPPEDDRWYRVTLRWPDGTDEVCEELVRRSHVVDVVSWEVNRRATATVQDRPVLHASVIAGPRGAIALSGASHHGKSTLAAAGALAGYVYLSDDLAPVDPDAMTVAPYPRPIMLRPGGRERLRALPATPDDEASLFVDDWYFAPSELGAAVARGPVPLVAVGFVDWAEATQLTALSRATCLHRLIDASTNLEHQGAAGFRVLERLATLVPGFELECADVDEALDALVDVIGALP